VSLAGALTCTLALALTAPVFAQNADADAVRAQQKSVQRDQQALRARIATLQKQIDARDAARKDATDALRASERTLSTLTRQLTRLKQNVAEANKRLAALQADIAAQTQALATRRAALADQLRAQYASGMTSPWAALLAGENPQALGRQLTYLDYVSRARADEAQALRRLIAQLDTLHGQAREQREALERLHAETARRQAEQQTQQRAHATLLARLDGQLKAQRAESDRLARDDARLSQLLTDLAQQLEMLRREAARRQAEHAEQAKAAARAGPARLPMPVARAAAPGAAWSSARLPTPRSTPLLRERWSTPTGCAALATCSSSTTARNS